jgi:hypothetical protein
LAPNLQKTKAVRPPASKRRTLRGYINNILNVSRYDHKRFRFLKRRVLQQLLKDWCDLACERALSTQTHLSYSVDLQQLPPTAQSGEVASSLIDNALNTAENGEIITTATIKDEDMVEAPCKPRHWHAKIGCRRVIIKFTVRTVRGDVSGTGLGFTSVSHCRIARRQHLGALARARLNL